MRESTGNWIKGFIDCIGQASPSPTELWAIYYGLQLAWDLRAPSILDMNSLTSDHAVFS